MKVYEFQCRIQFLTDVEHSKIIEKVNYLLDSVLVKDEEYLKFHESKEYKFYVVDAPYPIEKDRVYKKGKEYTLRIRSVKEDLIHFFVQNLYQHQTEEILCIGGKVRVIPKRMIDKIYCITPVIIKNDFGYWRDKMSFPDFENRLFVNLIKKYQDFTEKEIGNENDIHFYDKIEFANKKDGKIFPIKVAYKNIHLLGDKIDLKISADPMAQKLAYFALGVGLGEGNSRGFGFVNYKFL